MPMRKVALVTGAGSGIGKASALALMRNGFSVVLNGRRKEPLEAGAVEGRAFGAEAIAVAGDVADPVFVKALFGEAKAAIGRVEGCLALPPLSKRSRPSSGTPPSRSISQPLSSAHRKPSDA